MTQSRLVVAWVGVKGDEREGLQRSRRKLSGVMEVFAILIIVIVSRVYTYVKTYQITHFKYVQLIVYKTSTKLFFTKRIMEYHVELKFHRLRFLG